jgi:hypothetical protein
MEDIVMKTLNSILTLMLIAGLFLIVPVATTYSERQAVLPTIAEGTFWQFKAATTFVSGVSRTKELGGDYEVIYQDDKLRVFILNGDERTEIEDVRAEELKRMIAFGQDGRKYLDFPLSVGKKWNTPYLVRLPGSRFTIQRNVGYVKGIENVQTPGGNFEAFRIDGWLSGNAWIDGTYSGPYTVFYAPQAGSIVKLLYENKSNVGDYRPRHEIELVKLGLAK